MKTRWYRRLLLLLFWLLSAGLFALTIGLSLKQMSLNGWAEELLGAAALPVLIAAGVVYLIVLVLALVALVKPPKRREEKGFVVVETNDAGKVRMAIPAIEQLARQAANGVEGVRDLKPVIVGLEDAIDVNVTATIVNGVHIPSVTMNLQRVIRQYVEMNCGIPVHQVTVSILSVMKPEENEHRVHAPLKERIEEFRREKEAEPQVAPVEERTLEENPAQEVPAAPIATEEPILAEEPAPIHLTLGEEFEAQPQGEAPEEGEVPEAPEAEDEERYEE